MVSSDIWNDSSFLTSVVTFYCPATRTWPPISCITEQVISWEPVWRSLLWVLCVTGGGKYFPQWERRKHCLFNRSIYALPLLVRQPREMLRDTHPCPLLHTLHKTTVGQVFSGYALPWILGASSDLHLTYTSCESDPIHFLCTQGAQCCNRNFHVSGMYLVLVLVWDKNKCRDDTFY